MSEWLGGLIVGVILSGVVMTLLWLWKLQKRIDELEVFWWSKFDPEKPETEKKG